LSATCGLTSCRNTFGANFADYQDGEAVFSDPAAKRIDAMVDNRRSARRGVFGRFVPTGVEVAHFSNNVKTMTAATDLEHAPSAASFAVC